MGQIRPGHDGGVRHHPERSSRTANSPPRPRHSRNRQASAGRAPAGSRSRPDRPSWPTTTPGSDPFARTNRIVEQADRWPHPVRKPRRSSSRRPHLRGRRNATRPRLAAPLPPVQSCTCDKKLRRRHTRDKLVRQRQVARDPTPPFVGSGASCPSSRPLTCVGTRS